MAGDDAAGRDDVSEVLVDGESAVLVCDALVRESGVIMDRCRVVLTEARVVILKQGWPWGYKVDRSIPRAECSLQNHKVRFDGSELVLVQHEGGVLCLYFARQEAEASAAFREQISDGQPSPA